MTQETAQAKTYPVTDDIREAMQLIARGTDTFLIESEFEQKLARAKATGRPLRCKLGLTRRLRTFTSATRWCSTSFASSRTSATR